MRYTEPKDKSAELLRLALAHMGRNQAAFNPLTFTLWYEFVAGTNPRLNKAIDALTQQGVAIDDERVLHLCREHVFPPDEDNLDRIRGEMQQLMLGMARSAGETSRDAGNFGAQLDGLTAALDSRDVGLIRPQVEDVLAGTARMKQSVDDLRTRVEASQSEVERLRQALERARGEAMIDPLTGVLNRKGFDKTLQAMLAAEPLPGNTHVLVMLDIDHFKKVNDTHGHLIGDRVIQGVGEILRSSVNAPRAAAARYGGEEFAILLPQKSLADSQQITETVRARTKALKIRNRNTQEVLVTVTVSGGLAAWRPGDSVDDIVARADAALYASKHAGRDRITVA
jgi:diguanylate cyclase